MAVSDRVAAMGPYAQQLLDNNEVRATARQAADATRAAYQRARGQDARKAVKDRKLRRRVTAAVAAVGEFVGAVSESSPKQKSPWPRRIALLAAVAAGAWLIGNETGRARIQELLDRQRSGNEPHLSTTDEPNPS
jgi:hypothetical protein